MAADLDPYAYEASDEASETELLDKSLSVWKGWSSLESNEDFKPIPLDLHTAASIGQYDCVRGIVDKNDDDLNKKNKGGWTPLMYAAYIGHDNVVNLLLEANVSVHISNNKGQTALHLAASCGNESVAYFLIQAGAELEAKDDKGWTALFHATYSGHQMLVKFLLDNSANMEATEPSCGLTPFMEAATEGHEIIVHTFLQQGVNVHAKAHNGDTAQSLALMHGYMKIVSMIDNHVNPLLSHRGEVGLRGDLSSSDEAYQRPRHKGSRFRSRGGPSIQDGPAAFARLMNKSKTPPSDNGVPLQNACVPSGYMTFYDDGTVVTNEQQISSRDMTSPINADDHKLDSSGGTGSKDSVRSGQEPEEDDNAFSKTGALTIKSSSSSSGGLVAALGIQREESPDSNDNDTPIKTTRDPIPTEERKPKSWQRPNRHNSGGRYPRNREYKRIEHSKLNHELGAEKSSPAENSAQNQLPPSGPHRVNPTVPPGFTPLPGNNHDLEDETLESLLNKLGLAKYITLFAEQDVDIQVFLSLTDNDLKEVGVKLFGPRRKMTNAIARWHSNAAPAAESLEQAYADKLEAEMQEMAINLHQTYDQMEKLKAQVLQEQELRSVTEGCLMEDRKMWQHVHRIAVDMRQHSGETAAIVQRLSSFQKEFKRRLLQYSGEGDLSQPTENPYDLTIALQEGLQLDKDPANEIHKLSTEHLVKQSEFYMEELKHSLSSMAINTDKLLGQERIYEEDYESLS